MEAYYKEGRQNQNTFAQVDGQTYSSTVTTPISKSSMAPLLPAQLCFLSGYRQANWKSLIKQGTGATTQCSGEMWSASLPRLKLKSEVRQHFFMVEEVKRGQDLKSYFQVNAWPFTQIGTAPADVMARVRNRVIAKFIARCNEARSVIESGQDIGEYKQTLDSIRSPLGSMRSKLLNYLNTLSGVKRKGKKISLPRALADSYLELHFGVAPLVDDVAKIVGQCGSKHIAVQRISARAEEAFIGSDGREDFSGYMTSGDPNQAYQPFATYSENSVFQMEYKGAIHTGADSSGSISRVQELQLLPRNWLPTVWDLLPYSWIADYFINIGEIVGALSFVYADLAWGNQTSRIRRRREYSPLGYSNALGAFGPDPNWVFEKNEISVSSDRTVFEAHAFNRSPLNPSDLLPTVEIKLPHSKWAFANIGALLIQRASKIVPFL